MAVSIVAKNTCKDLAEGLFWEESTKSLVYVDIAAGDIHRWSTITDEDTKIHIGKSVHEIGLYVLIKYRSIKTIRVVFCYFIHLYHYCMAYIICYLIHFLHVCMLFDEQPRPTNI